MKIENAIALGTFDGVHIGHRAVLDIPNIYNKVAFTFDYPPKSYFTGNKEVILTGPEKTEALISLGINQVALESFESFKDMTAEDFLNYLLKEFAPKYISCGFNYRFGKNGEGDTKLLKAFCDKNNIVFNCVAPVELGGLAISSTFIREYLRNGEIEKANELLLNPFSLEGVVEAGDQRGRTIGFPTINQNYPQDKVEIKAGVYKSKVSVFGKTYNGLTYVGKRPSFETKLTICETYIQNFNGDLYGENVKVEFIKFLRDEVKFESCEKLKEQLNIDIASI